MSLIAAPIFVLTITLTGHGLVSVPVDKAVIQEIWEDVAEITGIPANWAAPRKIRLVSKTKKNHIAAYFPASQKIEFYLNNFRNNFWAMEKTLQFAKEDVESFFYHTLAHEMLHHVLKLSGISDKEHHACMKEEEYLTQIMERNDARLSRHGFTGLRARWLANYCLEYGIELDQKKS